ncbi:hypothetical protein LXA47_09845 [Massilia sp. P8910]|uniref:hypothetical protein n=1 Tax=Massilia antarctica TaxID=2765360 RepID=UPI0011AFAD43|nr:MULTISPECIES: hypothetical protein [Massilia]MCE3603904.1 hypothetical protein [Massilia antarctica]MCY0911833.1 hypothetical protein [Massilia sp. H27-R4]
MYRLAQHQQQRNLVSISRSGIDAHSMEAFVLGVSEELVLLQYVYDFHLDGLMILRIADLTVVECSETCKFQRELLVQDGLLEQVPFDSLFDLRNWHTVLTQLANAYPLMILECEKLEEPDFVIGRVDQVTPEEIDFDYFSGTGRWGESLTTLALADITSCQVETSYIKAYQRYFERTASLP